jgi:hypothetical protein
MRLGATGDGESDEYPQPKPLCNSCLRIRGQQVRSFDGKKYG